MIETNNTKIHLSRIVRLSQDVSLVQKTILIITGLMILFEGLNIWVKSNTVPNSNIVALIGTLSGLFIIISSFLSSFTKSNVYLERFALFIFIIVFSSWVYGQIYTNPGYGTDELAFDQYAAQIFVQGIDPYTVSMQPSLDLFQVPAIFNSYDLSGAKVEQLSYPSLSFLLYAPLLLMGLQNQLAIYVDSFFWILTIIMLYWLLPRPYKLLSIVVGLSNMYQDYVVGGVTDALFMPFLILGAWKWDQFGNHSEKSIARWIGPIAFGLAACVKQTTWFLIPFVVLGIFLENQNKGLGGLKLTLKYFLMLSFTFLIVNLPFILWHPVYWFTGIFAPFLHSLVPDGQGLVNLTTFEHLGGGNLGLYTTAGALLVLAFLALEAMNYKKIKPVLFIIPSVVLLVPTRSFASYLIDLFPGFLVSIMTTSRFDSPSYGVKWYMNRFVQLSLFVPSALCIVLAISSPAPLKLSIQNIHTTGQMGTIDNIKVEVTNERDTKVSPHFTIRTTNITTFWNIIKGPTIINPHQTASYVLAAPNVESMPSIIGGFAVDAFTQNPSALSTTAEYNPNVMHTRIVPNSVNDIVPVNSSVTLQVQLYDNLGKQIKQQGVKVYLGQVIYDQKSLLAGESSIDGNPIGKSPVEAETNQNGVALFQITTDKTQKNPIFYQSFLLHQRGYPFGYSQMLSILFK